MNLTGKWKYFESYEHGEAVRPEAEGETTA